MITTMIFNISSKTGFKDYFLKYYDIPPNDFKHCLPLEATRYNFICF